MIGVRRRHERTRESGAQISLSPAFSTTSCHCRKGLASYYGAALKVPIPSHTHSSRKSSKAQGPRSKTNSTTSHNFVKGNVEWGKEAKGTERRRLPRLLRSRSLPACPRDPLAASSDGMASAGNGAFITNATSCPGHNTTTLSARRRQHRPKRSHESGRAKPYTTLFGARKAAEMPFAPAFALSSGSTHERPARRDHGRSHVPQSPERRNRQLAGQDRDDHAARQA